jgi:hypothetical protein
MDYVFSGVNIYSNMTVMPGTTIGWFKPASGNPYAIFLADKIVFSFNGQVDAMDYFVRTSTAQEGNSSWGAGISGYGIVGSHNQDVEPISYSSEIHMNFTLMAGLIWDVQFRDYSGYLIARANNSIIAGGNAGGYLISFYLTNCLMDNQQIGNVYGYPGNELYLRNCTFHYGNYYVQRVNPIYVSVRDCVFDRATLTLTDSYRTNSLYTDYDYNAYTNAVDPFPIGGSHDQQSVNFNWQTGPLGKFYLPSTSPLIDTGDVTADAVGLYHFTTQTDAYSTEGTSTVDIGYHYVGVDSYGNPLDYDSDGTPDYLEDPNGNGLVDSGETDWTSSSDTGLKVVITQPRNTAP